MESLAPLTSCPVVQQRCPAPPGRGDGALVSAGIREPHIPQLQGGIAAHHLLHEHGRAALEQRSLLLQVVLPTSELMNRPGYSRLVPPDRYAAHPDVGLESAAQDAALADDPWRWESCHPDRALSCKGKARWCEEGEVGRTEKGQTALRLSCASPEAEQARAPVAATSAASRGHLLWLLYQNEAQKHSFSKRYASKSSPSYLRRFCMLFSCLFACIRDLSLCSFQQSEIFVSFLSQDLPLCSINVTAGCNAGRETRDCFFTLTGIQTSFFHLRRVSISRPWEHRSLPKSNPNQQARE